MYKTSCNKVLFVIICQEPKWYNFQFLFHFYTIVNKCLEKIIKSVCNTTPSPLTMERRGCIFYNWQLRIQLEQKNIIVKICDINPQQILLKYVCRVVTSTKRYRISQVVGFKTYVSSILNRGPIRISWLNNELKQDKH